eukprot:529122_1
MPAVACCPVQPIVLNINPSSAFLQVPPAPSFAPPRRKSDAAMIAAAHALAEADCAAARSRSLSPLSPRNRCIGEELPKSPSATLSLNISLPRPAPLMRRRTLNSRRPRSANDARAVKKAPSRASTTFKSLAYVAKAARSFKHHGMSSVNKLEKKLRRKSEEITYVSVKLEKLEIERNDLEMKLYMERRKSEQHRELITRIPEMPLVTKVEGVTVIFADIVGFTEICGKIESSEHIEKIHQLLQNVFSTMDTQTRRFGLLRLKTIGDAYMACAGVRVPTEEDARATEADRGRNARAAADFVLACRSELCNLQIEPNGIPIRFRYGMHIGAVVAGMLSPTNTAYDIWGQTVNVASRLESLAEPNKICVSQEMYDSLHKVCSLKSRGTSNVKGCGVMQTYYLEGYL